jgi:hypothetical protein
MYAEARQVCFWLGHGTSIAKLTDVELLIWWDPSRERRDTLDRLVKEVLYCDFWSRTWIVQEVLRGQHRGKILYGNESWDFVEFANSVELAREVIEVGRSPAWQLLKTDFATPHRSPEGQDSTFGPSQPLRIHTAFRDDEGGCLADLLSILDEFFDRTACSDERDRIFVPMTLLGGTAASMVDYSLSASQIYVSLLGRWVQGESTGAKSVTVEAFVQAERVLRRTLGLETAGPSRLGSIVDKAQRSWSVALRFEAVAQVEPGPQTLNVLFANHRSLMVSDRRPPVRAFERCHCKVCGPGNDCCDKSAKLALFSSGDKEGHGPHFLLCESRPGIHSIAYGALYTRSSSGQLFDNRLPLRIVRPDGLQEIDTTALQGAFQFERLAHRGLEQIDDPFFDLKARPSDILNLLWYDLGQHVVEPPDSRQVRCDLLTQPDKKGLTKGQA